LRILLLGVNHKTVPLDVREAASFSKSKVIEALPALQGIAGEAVVLSTCNRTEIYVTTSDEKKFPLESNGSCQIFTACPPKLSRLT